MIVSGVFPSSSGDQFRLEHKQDSLSDWDQRTVTLFLILRWPHTWCFTRNNSQTAISLTDILSSQLLIVHCSVWQSWHHPRRTWSDSDHVIITRGSFMTLLFVSKVFTLLRGNKLLYEGLNIKGFYWSGHLFNLVINLFLQISISILSWSWIRF